jgi:glutamate dehydrogenase
MSGDVFGNGMLLSRAIRLVAAFDHRDIFIDPDPDPETSYAERLRLFQLPRSSWQDYDAAKISPGGGVFSRSAKYITLSPQAQALLGLGAQVTPQDIMTAILKAAVDLMWFGGIGTFVRASTETDAQAGDRTNDAIRITGADINAKVIGEGANLGLTQKARIEYALRGGRLNTDAIDNSAGVNSSDYEVNIKIAFGGAISAGRIDIAERNRILTNMTDQVASAVLRNNYLQTLAISLGERRGLSDFGFQQLLMRKLEAEGTLDRALEALPNDLAIAERRSAGKALTRPELAVLLAYAKLSLHEDLINSDIPNDPYLGRELFRYFPQAMRERFADEIAHHPLRREIIATVLTNDIINRGGSTFVVRLVEETGHSPADIAYAFTAAKDVYGLDDLYAAIDALDGKIDGGRQLDLYRDVQDLLRRQAAWFLRHGDFSLGLEPEIARYREGVNHLTRNMAEALPDPAEADLHAVEATLLAEHIPHSCALRLAAIAPLAQALDVAMAANKGGIDVIRAARILFEVRDAFKLHDLTEASEALGAGDYFDRLAVNSTLASISAAQRTITGAVIETGGANADFEAWRAANADAVSRVSRSIADILESGPLTLAKLTVAVAQLRDVARV